MLKILLLLFKSYLAKFAYKVNNKFVKSKNRNNNMVFLSKSKILTKNLFKFKSFKAIRKRNFLISNIQIFLIFLK